MKTFFIVLAVFLLLLALILWNVLYINRLGFDLKSRLDALPDAGAANCAAEVQEFVDHWQTHRVLVGLSVGYPTVDRICEQAAVLLACAECGDLYGYRTALALLYDAIEDMQRLEQLPFFSMFAQTHGESFWSIRLRIFFSSKSSRSGGRVALLATRRRRNTLILPKRPKGEQALLAGKTTSGIFP